MPNTFWWCSLRLCWCLGLTGLLMPVAFAERFYVDDPIWKEPPPRSVENVQPVKLDNLIDFYKNQFRKKGERNSPGNVHPSQGVNTLGEVPDSSWYTNRHALHRMSQQELATGPCTTGAPAPGQWTVTAAKSEGVTPGFTIHDSRGRRYLLKFDPPGYLDLATAADVIGAKVFYALGYNVPENYIVSLRREQLDIKPGVRFTDRFGRERELKPRDLDELLKPLPRNPDGTWRGMASFYLPGKPLGGFKYYKRRLDDPNELAPHEHLRVLRGLYVFAAWMNHTDAKSLNSLDTLVEEDGRKFVKHNLIDFGASLGSDSVDAKDPRLGHRYFIDWGFDAAQLFTLGFIIPDYARVNYPDRPGAGNFSAQAFRPERWTSNYPNAAFLNRLWGDEFWGATKVMAFTDEDIRTMVHTGQYSDQQAERTIADVLIARRDIIGKFFFSRMAPLDRFRVEANQLRFDDLAAQHGFRSPVNYQIAWARFDNQQNRREPLSATGAQLPDGSSEYLAATITGDPSNRGVTVYLRRDGSGWKVAGVDREGADTWEAQ